MAGKRTCENTRDELRSYLLETLSERARRAVAAHVEACPGCQEALEAERGRLSVLDVLPREEAPEGLAERALARIAAGGDKPAEHKLEGDPTAGEPSFAGLAVAAAILFVLSCTFFFSLGKAREAARRASTQGNMKRLGLIFKMYANENEGERFPDLSAVQDAWSPDITPLYSKYMTDPQVLISEAHPERKALLKALQKALKQPEPDFRAAERLVGESFGYLGYTVKNEAEFLALRKAKDAGALPAGDSGITVPESGDSVFPLREGIERFLITDINNPAGSSQAQSTIPIVVDIAPWKYKKSVERYRGANVLFMDGHVEFVRYGTFPVVDSVLNALSGIE